jgi:hypothetical protein
VKRAALGARVLLASALAWWSGEALARSAGGQPPLHSKPQESLRLTYSAPLECPDRNAFIEDVRQRTQAAHTS